MLDLRVKLTAALIFEDCPGSSKNHRAMVGETEVSTVSTSGTSVLEKFLYRFGRALRLPRG
jgi:hypothetical protein